MSKKAKLSQLHKELTATPKAESRPEPKLEVKVEKKPKPTKKINGANPIRGERGDFLKVTITLPPDMLANLKRLGIERKLQGMRDTDVSSLIREALTNFLESQG